MPKNRKRNSPGRTVGLLLLGLLGLALLIKVLLQGNNVALFNPKGMIAQEQLGLMILAVGIMLVIAIPTLFLLYFTAWKYRESNARAKRDPNAGHGRLLNVGMWLVPGIFAVVLALIMWPATHKLEPQKQIAANTKPLTIQVVALRWKWLFIYPEQKIAAVNFVQVPTDTPVEFKLTADESSMSSFWIPNLGGMLYAMTGHVNQLNLIAETPGDYPGSSAEINGAGFAGMKFTARASSKNDFDLWVQDMKQFPDSLDTAQYNRLLKPSENNPTAFYSAVDDNLYGKILMKYMGAGHEHTPAPYHGGH
ncbi:MAG TPA: COX aromatic rich motif-containing protein [Candidatus Saccharimonadales bacterium]|nr:COX aromatic rich motif-containing protein [Candidatus Saccharimonadales bacterium]